MPWDSCQAFLRLCAHEMRHMCIYGLCMYVCMRARDSRRALRGGNLCVHGAALIDVVEVQNVRLCVSKGWRVSARGGHMEKSTHARCREVVTTGMYAREAALQVGDVDDVGLRRRLREAGEGIDTASSSCHRENRK